MGVFKSAAFAFLGITALAGCCSTACQPGHAFPACQSYTPDAAPVAANIQPNTAETLQAEATLGGARHGHKEKFTLKEYYALTDKGDTGYLKIYSDLDIDPDSPYGVSYEAPQ